MRWIARQYEWTFPRPTLLMGIVNVTPDSFSDGGRFLDPERAVDHALQLAAEGADLLDIGGESTRPGAPAVPPEEELRRVLPVIERLAHRTRLPLSIDTRKAGVAEAALAAGAALINDVGAAQNDPAMRALVARSGAGYVCMHMLGSPETMQDAPRYADVVGDVRRFLDRELRRLAQAGVALEQVAVDVGIGFGKTLEHNLSLLGNLECFTSLQRPVLLGASRKSFISKVLNVGLEERLTGSIACAAWAVCRGVQILRVHDVAATRQAVRMIEAVRNRAG